VGDRVMLTENDDENDVMNGDVGTIVDAYAKPTPSGATRNMIKIKFDCGHDVEYPAAQWRKLILAYAMTVHKSQGSQYPAVIMPVCSAHERMLDRSLLYTGWTRAKSSLFIVGERDVIEKAVANIEASKRDTRLQEFIRHFSVEMGLAGRPELAAIAPPAAPRAAAPAPLRRPPGPPPAAPVAASRAPRPVPPPLPRMAPRPLPGIGQARAPAPQVSVTSVPVSPVRRPPPPPPRRPTPAPQPEPEDLHQIPSMAP
jgi:exodeoxyribonuclease V alpha subunit